MCLVHCTDASSESAGSKGEPADKPVAVVVQTAVGSGEGEGERKTDVELSTDGGGAGRQAVGGAERAEEDGEETVVSAQLVSATDGETERDPLQAVNTESTKKEENVSTEDAAATVEQHEPAVCSKEESAEGEGEVPCSSGKLQGGEAGSKDEAAAESGRVSEPKGSEIAPKDQGVDDTGEEIGSEV